MRISDWSSDVCSSDLWYWQSGQLAAKSNCSGRGSVGRNLHLKMRPTWRSTVRYAGRFHAHSLAFTGYDTRVGSVADLVCGGDRHFRRWPRRGIGDHRPVCFFADVPFADRKSVVWGKSVSVRVALGWRWIIKKKKKQTYRKNRTNQ